MHVLILFCLQSFSLPSISAYKLLDFSFDDMTVSDDETLLSTLAMLVDLQVMEHFNVDYQVSINM